MANPDQKTILLEQA